MTVYQQILEWSTSRPLWQRDTLRRLVQTGTPSDADINEIAKICVAEVSGGDTSTATALGPEHLPAPASVDDPITLRSITHVRDVNQLAPGAVLPFSPTGLTVIYGKNGAGKSGYGRILKQVCRTRGRATAILPNALDPSATSTTPEATITYQVGDVANTDTWIQGQAGATALGRVSVFDTHSATAHVDGAMSLAYLPAGLELFQHLAQVCKRVDEQLRATIEDLQARKWSPPADLLSDETIKTLIGQLGKPGIGEMILAPPDVTEEQRQRLATVEGQLAILKQNDPQKVIAQHRTTARRLATAADRMQQLVDALNDEALTEILALRVRASTTRDAADLARRELAREPLPEVGGAVWRELWEAARAYSTQAAYPSHPHPHTGDDAVCLLCQQPLSADAASRLKRFEAFISGHAQQAAKQADDDLAAKVRSAQGLPLQAADTVEEFNALQAQLGDRFSQVVEVARKRAGVVSQLSAADDPASLISDAPAWPTLQAPELRVLAKQEEEKAAELEAALDPEGQRRLEEERTTLSAIAAFTRDRQLLTREHERARSEESYTKAKRSCNTKAITDKQTELANEVVTKTLREAFARELHDLGGGRIPASLEPAPGQRGVPYQRVALEGAMPNTKVVEVLSEGELRVVALAGFLTDLAAANDGSALVFDDPVSSLDADYREKVAARLAQEAARRQVIVFTHDLSFLAYLYEQTDASGQTLAYRELDWAGGKSGCVSATLPQVGASVKDRLGQLKQRNAQSKRYYSGVNRDDARWRSEAEQMAVQLRKAWERAVEAHLLYGVVQRHLRDIQTKRVDRIVIQQDDVAELNAAMTLLSCWGAHEGSAEMNPSVPSPADIDKAIDDLGAWCQRIESARQTKPKKPAIAMPDITAPASAR